MSNNTAIHSGNTAASHGVGREDTTSGRNPADHKRATVNDGDNAPSPSVTFSSTETNTADAKTEEHERASTTPSTEVASASMRTSSSLSSASHHQECMADMSLTDALSLIHPPASPNNDPYTRSFHTMRFGVAALSKNTSRHGHGRAQSHAHTHAHGGSGERSRPFDTTLSVGEIRHICSVLKENLSDDEMNAALSEMGPVDADGNIDYARLTLMMMPPAAAAATR